MLRTIVKRDGSLEEFTPSKLNKWAIWASDSLEDRVDWSTVVLDALNSCGEAIESQDLQLKLIDSCLAMRDWPHNLMAGRLYSAYLHKKMYGEAIPTVKDLYRELSNRGYTRKFNFTDEEFTTIETFIDHKRDFHLAHFQINQIVNKYSIHDRVKKEQYETPQFTYMRMAMALSDDETNSQVKLKLVKDFYEEFSNNRINPPSPNYINLGTHHNGYASCCLYTVEDTAKSLAIGDHIAYMMTVMSSGIGGYLNVRSMGEPIRNGIIKHQGKLPYFSSLAKAVTANIQAGRGGACTTYYSCFDSEADVITMLQNPRSTDVKKNRDIHFAILTNRLFARKVKENKDIFTFSVKTAPDLTELFFTGDQDAFEDLYNKYDTDVNFKKNYVSARSICLLAMQQGHEVSTHYQAIIDEINRHTSFKEPIYSSNLCMETTQASAPYKEMMDLYSEEDQGSIVFNTDKLDSVYKDYNDVIVLKNRGITFAGDIKPGDVLAVNDSIVTEIVYKVIPPEVSLCSLAAIVEPNISSDEQYEKSCYYALLMVDKCIHISDYILPHVGFTAKQRLNAGIGMLGIASTMAKSNVKYSSQEGKDKLHQIFERHAYFTIKASLKLGKELGNAPWIHKTKWANGWLPIDTYKKSVDEITQQGYMYDWESLRADIVSNKGIRNSALINMMPTESSSKASGQPNGVYPIRSLSIKKSDHGNVVDWCAPDGDIIGNQYEIAWNIPTEEMIKCYAVMQKFIDQSISADLYQNRVKDLYLSDKQLLKDYLTMVKYGVKTRYYQNSLTADQSGNETENEVTEVCTDGGCKL